MFSNVEIKNEALDVQIKQEQILDEANNSINKINSSPTLFSTTEFIKQEDVADVNNSFICDKTNDLMPKRKRPKSDETKHVNTVNHYYDKLHYSVPIKKRPRSDDTGNTNTPKRTKTPDGIPNFRRPWPTTHKPSVLYSSTCEEKVTHSYTDYSISNIIKENKLNSQNVLKDKSFQNQNYTCVPDIHYPLGNGNFKEKIKKHMNIDSNLVGNECDEFISISDIKSNFERQSLMATISEVQKDLNITNDSEDEYEYVNIKCEKSDNYMNDYITKDINQDIKTQSNLNHSNHIWTIQKPDTEKLKVVISKGNNNSPHSKPMSIIPVNSSFIDRDEQQLISKGNNYSPHSKPIPKMQVDNSYIDRDEQPLISNMQKTIEREGDRQLSNSKIKRKKKMKKERPIENISENLDNSLLVSIPSSDIKKKKRSNSLKRHSLPNTNDVKPNVNLSLSNHVNKKKIRHSLPYSDEIKPNINPSVSNQVEKKLSQAPRVFMKKLTWKNISQTEKLITEPSGTVYKMILNQGDGQTTEIAVKAHLESLDWLSLGLVPKTMLIEEGAVLSNLQGIKGVPYLCGIILEDPPALVMSYHKGRTIGDYLEEGDTLLALKTFVRACEIVGKINHRGWAHYDLHADNILGRVNNNRHIAVTLINYGFCRTTHVNPHYGIYSDPEDMEGHHLPIDIINKQCNGTYVDRFSLCYILEEIHSKMRESSETNEIRDASSIGLMTDQPQKRPSPKHLSELVRKLVGNHTHESWKFNIDD